MHIVLDGRKLHHGGIGTYIQALIEGFCSFKKRYGDVGLKNSRYNLTVIVAKKDLAHMSIYGSAIETEVDNSSPYGLAEYLVMPLRLRNLIADADVFHAPHFNLPYFLTAPAVVTIHDTILLTHPRRSYHAKVARMLIGSAIKRADRVITVSEASRDRVVENFPASEEKIRVVVNALPESFQQHASEPATPAHSESLGDYFLFIGNERTHKGFPILMRAWQQLIADIGEKAPKLIAIGSEFDQSKKFVVDNSLTNWIHFAGKVPDHKKDELIRDAQFLIMPSLEEGFGYPILESLSLGTPVICSDIPVFEELFPQGTLTVPEQSASGFAATLKSVIANPLWRNDLVIEAKAIAESFTLTKFFFETLAVYEECIH